MNLDWSLMYQSIPALFSGLWVTLKLVGIASILGLILGAIIATGRMAENHLARALSNLYVFFFRGSPLLVQMALFYFGMGQLEFVQESFLNEWFKSVFFCACLALSLNTGAYVSEIIRGAVGSIPKGELEAADALGFSKWLKLKRIIAPRAFTIMLPAYANEVIFVLKGSALASSITLAEITYQTKIIANTNYAFFETYLAAGILYLVISSVLLGGFYALEYSLRTPRH